MTLDSEHRPEVLAGSRHGSWWLCQCGAKGLGYGRPAVGWARHVAEVVHEEEASEARGEADL